MGTGMLSLGVVTLMSNHGEPISGEILASWGVMFAGTIQLAGSSFLLLRQSEGEKLARHFQEKISTPGYDPAQIVVQTETQLQLMLEEGLRITQFRTV